MDKILNQKSGESWAAIHGDSCEVLPMLPGESIGYSIYSVPFASLYVYSASDRDMGNCRNYDEFFEQMNYIAAELFRITQPGRLTSIHCMNLPTSKVRHGYIGLQDFRGDLVRCFQKSGWIYASEACIWKDPVTAMQRTKALGLLHKQIVKDSCMSRQGIPDYLVTLRKPGVNAKPVCGEFDEWIGDDSLKSEGRMSIDVWQRYASPVWMDINPSDTLQFRSARQSEDERHICPLQLQVIERGLELWSNPGDTILTPFMGIGSECYVAVERGRKAIGIELKESYFEQACANLQIAERKRKEKLLL